MKVDLNNVPLVSIIVPVFNGERYLRESLDSIAAQTYPQIEILVMDDASSDSTPDIIASYGDQVRYCRQEKNKGQFENVNDGIEMAKGEYIAVYHADDIYRPSIVECEVAFFDRWPSVGAVFCLDMFIDSRGHEVGRLELPDEVRGGRPLDYSVVLNALLKYKNRFLRGPSSMVRSSVYRDVGLYHGQKFRIASDLEMWVRIARKYPIGILEDYLFCYRRGHSNLSQKYYRLRTEQEHYFQIMDEHLEDGGWKVAASDALTAFQAHQAEDRLMRVIAHYILGQCEESRFVLNQVQLRHIRGSNQIQRGRLTILFLLLQFLVLVPKIPFVADMFYRRWHEKGK